MSSRFSTRTPPLLHYPLALAAALLTLLAVATPPVQAAKAVEFAWGGGAVDVIGGRFSSPSDVAVRAATGQVYVADSANNRIQRFDSNGNFELAWGVGVVAPGGAGDLGGPNEQQRITIVASGGGFTLKLHPWLGLPEEETPSIPFDASAAAVQSALEQLEAIEPGDVSVSGAAGGPFTIEFTGRYAGTDVSSLGWNDSGLTVPPGTEQPISLETLTAAGVFEKCTVASECRPGSAGGLGGFLNRPSELAIDEANGHLYVSESQAGRISQFDLDGDFQRAFGWDVVQPGKPGNVAGNERQVLQIGVDESSGEAPTGGTFQLKWTPPGSSEASETAAVPLKATAAQIEAALEGTPVLAPDDVSVTGPDGGPWTVGFGGAYADADLSMISGVGGDGDEQQLLPDLEPQWNSKGQDLRVLIQIGTALRDGGSYEVCEVAADCKSGARGAFGRPVLSSVGGWVVRPAQKGAAAEAGQLADVESLAVDPTSGNLLAGSLLRINEYASDGGFVRAFGWGVDTGAEQFEVCTAASGCQHTVTVPSIPGALDPFAANGQLTADAGAIAVSPAGVAYASTNYRSDDSSGNAERDKPIVMRFDLNGSAAADILLPDPITDSGPVGRCGYCTSGPLRPKVEGFGLDVDPDTGNLLFLEDEGVRELDPSTTPASLADTHLPNANLRFDGQGLDPVRERLYLSTRALGHRILALGDNPPPPTTVELEATTAIGPRGATLNGEITPNGPPGIATSYRFEYSRDGTSWTSVPIPDAIAGDGSSPVGVSQAISGLEVNKTYLVRLTASKPLGLGSITTPAESFKTLSIPPDATTLFPRARTATTAALTATVNANNLPTTYHFEYGADSSYGSQAPVPAAGLEDGQTHTVIEHVSGLEPGTTYHYRIVATNAKGTIFGDDVAFTTREALAAPEGRAYEMVTPPFKVVRTAVGFAAQVRNNPNTGVPSLAGETVLWQVPFFPLSDDVGSPANNDRRIIRRTPQGWVNETQNTLPMVGLTNFIQMNPMATSGDLESHALRTFSGVTASENDAGGLLPTEGSYANRLYTFRKGTGVEGFNPWLTNPEQQVIELLQGAEVDSDSAAYEGNGFDDNALFDDDGTAMVRWGIYGGLAEDPGTPGDDDPSDDKPLGGDNIYLQRAADPLAMPSASKDLVNECTGAGPSATSVPWIVAGSISSNQCADGSLVHRRGAVVGGGSQFSQGAHVSQGAATTALSEQGRRVFFLSPDPASARSSCSTEEEALTDCPPQLFVRSYDASDNPTVRWISHSRSVPGEGNGFAGTAFPDQLIEGQQLGQMGAGVGFQGASRSGDVVYFQTNAPLVPTDPNGGASITSGSASNASWDLYRYELPASLDADPDTGTLLRISGGPDGSADPNTNPLSFATNKGAALRYLSDDGRRAYFVTGAPIAGADAVPPTAGATTPGEATSAGSNTIRNLYLFDDTGSGPPEYRFIARLPFATSAIAPACASFSRELGFHVNANQDSLDAKSENCFRGTPDGRHVVFFTNGQLTGDDDDTHGDVYLYDAVADELTRVSAPPPGAQPYVCDGKIAEPVSTTNGCNADLGISPSNGLGGAAYGAPNPRGFSGLRHYNVSANPDGPVSVFFESRSELVPEDTNGDYWDVYEWREGELSLISPGNTQDDSWFSGNSLDGQDVFIWTSARIDPREIDPSDFDLYDARRGPDAGFPFTPPPTPCDVLALGCEGGATAPPHPPTWETGAARSGNATEKPKPRSCRKGKVRRRGRCVKRRRAAKARPGARKRGKGKRRRAKAGAPRKGARR